MKIRNDHYSDLTLPNGQTVPKGRAIEVREEDLQAWEKHSVVRAWFEGRYLVPEEAQAAAPDNDGGEGGGLKAVHRGSGSYSVMDGDQELVEGLTKAEAKAFNALPDEEKLAFVESRQGA